MARKINLFHGANPSLWPARIPVSKAYQYIGMARQTWYNTYRKEWHVEKLADGTNYLSRETVKMLQDRWIGAATNLRDQEGNDENWKYLYLKDQFEQALRLQFEGFLNQALPDILNSALAVINDEAPYDDIMAYIQKAKSPSRSKLPPEDDVFGVEDTIKAMREYSSNPEPDHPNQVYLQDQLDTHDTHEEDLPDDILQLAQNWETTDD